MRKYWPTVLLFILLGSTAHRAAGIPSFDRYQIILDRQPFGEPPTQPVITEPPPNISAAESFARAIRLSMIYEMENGDIRVGLINAQSKDHFFLSVGENHEGIELVSPNFEEAEAVLRRGAEMVIIHLQDGSVQPVTTTEQRDRLRTRQSSYEDRRRARQEAVRRVREEPPKPKLTGAALEEHLKNYQMEVIRQGLPPLPIPLTPEMDRQLVEEGILPP